MRNVNIAKPVKMLSVLSDWSSEGDFSSSVLVNFSSSRVFSEDQVCHTHLCSRLLELSTAACYTIYTFKYSGYMFEAIYRRTLVFATSKALVTAVEAHSKSRPNACSHETLLNSTMSTSVMFKRGGAQETFCTVGQGRNHHNK